ncbi:antitoxin [Streptomyces yaizuensis]|uniref:Antitoxin n=1 Tax=Streptomyces yaizuensis TaxID=2989713 RepID=A0ABQ5NUH9_9ACTN|nr:antitoxin [Streptomyces sp. YSPA8]GLF94005.1 antitoxin [Streptomyces sp. YSPA8]
MSMLDKLKQMLKGHESKVDQGVDKAGDAFDARTKGKYSRHVDTAQEKLKGQFGTGSQAGRPPNEPPAQSPPTQPPAGG